MVTALAPNSPAAAGLPASWNAGTAVVFDRAEANFAAGGSGDAGGGGYDALESRGRRRAPRSRIAHADKMLTQHERKSIIATSQDLQRNFAIARWAIQKHLDFVTSFTFQAATEDDDFNDELEAFIAEKEKAHNFDAAGRHPRRRFMRLLEAQRVVAGDVGALKRMNGTLQAIEGDRIRNPQAGAPPEVNLVDYIHGVRFDKMTGKAISYIINNRNMHWGGGGYEFQAVVPARFLYLHAWYDRFDQLRGMTPLTAAINLLQDLHESKDYALAKMKIEQLFGIKYTSASGEAMAPTSGVIDDDEDGEEKPPYTIDFGKGIFQLHLDEGDDAEFMQGNSPSQSFQEFWKTLIIVALKALDIPFSFFDESFTNFFGSRGSLMQYVKSCNDKRADQVDFLRWWTNWRVALAVADGELKLPAGMKIADIAYKWVAAGVPWWDPAKEVRGDAMAVAAGFDNYEDVCMRAGTGSPYDNIDINAKVQKYAKEKGVQLVLPGASGFNPETVIDTDHAEKEAKPNG